MISPAAVTAAAPGERAHPADLEETARRIEGWLLDSGAQLAAGPHRGGVAGRLDATGRPEFVYLEITGYYLTAMAWLAGGGAGSEERAATALARGRDALEWMRAVTAGGAVPATRIHLSPGADDWRNRAVFSFDLAMAARGVACFAAADPGAATTMLLGDLGDRLREISPGAVPLASHRALGGGGASLPDRWSTRPAPHHLKAAAALARLREGVLGPALTDASLGTIDHWAAAMQASWPCEELHTLLYGVEGLVIVASGGNEDLLDVVEPLYRRILRLQRIDGTLPALAGAWSGGVRADVLAQALRIGEILRTSGRLQEDAWAARLEGLAAALLRHVRPDGGVLFSLDQEVTNTWCAMFAHQALLLHARPGDRALANRAADLLV